MLRRLLMLTLVWAAVGAPAAHAGLVAIYWISRNPITNHLFNTSDRTIDTLMIGAAVLAPVLVGAGDGRARAAPSGRILSA